MREHFNQLTPAEAERLALLLEELGEAQQAVGKILRHGYESFNPDKANSPTNREELQKELGDVKMAIDLMCDRNDVSCLEICNRTARKFIAVKQYLHHQ